MSKILDKIRAKKLIIEKTSLDKPSVVLMPIESFRILIGGFEAKMLTKAGFESVPHNEKYMEKIFGLKILISNEVEDVEVY